MRSKVTGSRGGSSVWVVLLAGRGASYVCCREGIRRRRRILRVLLTRNVGCGGRRLRRLQQPEKILPLVLSICH